MIKNLFAKTSHRPWPLPRRPWAMTMRWHDLLFAHWVVPAEVIKPLISPSLELDTFGGNAWIGVIPFHMSGVRPRFVPEKYGLAFPELNVRTYVRKEGRGGVWFFSLDASNRLAVRMARAWYRLPYYDAEMQILKESNSFAYRCRRIHRKSPTAGLNVRYKPAGPVYQAESGTLDHWLTERYCLYISDHSEKVRRADIHHHPWPLQKAEAEFYENSMTEQLNIQLPREKPVLHYAAELLMAAWTAKPA